MKANATRGPRGRWLGFAFAIASVLAFGVIGGDFGVGARLGAPVRLRAASDDSASRQGTAIPRPMPPGSRPITVLDPLVDSMHAVYFDLKTRIVQSARAITDAGLGFRPRGQHATTGAPVPSLGEILQQMIDDNRAFCGAAATARQSGRAEPTSALPPVPATADEIRTALATSFTVCDRAWAATSADNAATPADLPHGLGPSTRLGVLMWDSARLAEAQGTLVASLQAAGLASSSRGGR